MMVCVSEWASFGVNLGGIAEAELLSHGGQKLFSFFSPGKAGKHLPPKFKKMEESTMKNNHIIRRFAACAVAGTMLFTLCACGAGSDKKDDTYKVAVVKQMDHASLDEIAAAITAQLDAISKEKNVTIEYEVYSGQNDQSVLKQLGDQAIVDGVDAIIPIASTAAQVMALCAQDTKTPVVYAAVSDPKTAELTGLDYVTGTSDALETSVILDMMLAQNPDTQKVGLLYSLSEPNSATPIQEAKEYLDAKHISYVEQTGNTNDEVIAAASALVAAGVDAIFTPTDNVIMSAELAIYQQLAQAGIPHYTGADSFVRNGAFATCGVNYTDLGTRTADLAYQAMTEGVDSMEDVYYMEGGLITVNSETAKTLGIDPQVFAQLGEVVEVTTTKE